MKFFMWIQRIHMEINRLKTIVTWIPLNFQSKNLHKIFMSLYKR